MAVLPLWTPHQSRYHQIHGLDLFQHLCLPLHFEGPAALGPPVAAALVVAAGAAAAENEPAAAAVAPRVAAVDAAAAPVVMVAAAAAAAGNLQAQVLDDA